MNSSASLPVSRAVLHAVNVSHRSEMLGWWARRTRRLSIDKQVPKCQQQESIPRLRQTHHRPTTRSLLKRY